MPPPIQARINGGSNGFISQVTEGFTAGVKSIGSDILPVWAANQLGVETRSPTVEPVYDRQSPVAPPRQDNLLQSGGGANFNEAAGMNMQQSDNTMLLLVLAVGAAAFVLARS